MKKYTQEIDNYYFSHELTISELINVLKYLENHYDDPNAKVVFCTTEDGVEQTLGINLIHADTYTNEIQLDIQ